MQSSSIQGPQDETNPDTMNYFVHQAQRYINVYEQKQTAIDNSYKFIVAENERLTLAKNEADAPKDYILETIESNKIRIQKNRVKKGNYYKKRDRLNQRLAPIVDEEIDDLDKSVEESKSEVPRKDGS